MAIAVDTSINGFSGNIGATVTVAYTCTGANLILWVAIRCDADDITGVTYSGVSMTQVDKQTISGTVTEYLFVLAGPAAGAHNVVVSNSNAGVPSIYYAVASYTGASQSGQPDAHATDSQGTDPTAVPLTTVAANCWIVLCCSDDNDNTVTAGANAFERTAPGTFFKLFDTNATQSAGAHTMTIEHTSGTLKSLIASMAPAAASAAVVAWAPADARVAPFAPSASWHR